MKKEGVAPPETKVEDEPPPRRPDAAAVNELWRAEVPPGPRGPLGLLAGMLRRVLGADRDAQTAFNARQVQLDNEILDYIDSRFDKTHRHYDRILGLYGRHLGEADERHLILQEELVSHVHDLVRRIDLVLSEGERGRLGLEHALKEVRRRLDGLQERTRGG